MGQRPRAAKSDHAASGLSGVDGNDGTAAGEAHSDLVKLLEGMSYERDLDSDGEGFDSSDGEATEHRGGECTNNEEEGPWELAAEIAPPSRNLPPPPQHMPPIAAADAGGGDLRGATGGIAGGSLRGKFRVSLGGRRVSFGPAADDGVIVVDFDPATGVVSGLTAVPNAPPPPPLVSAAVSASGGSEHSGSSTVGIGAAAFDLTEANCWGKEGKEVVTDLMASFASPLKSHHHPSSQAGAAVSGRVGGDRESAYGPRAAASLHESSLHQRVQQSLASCVVYPARHHVMAEDEKDAVLGAIRAELEVGTTHRNISRIHTALRTGCWMPFFF